MAPPRQPDTGNLGWAQRARPQDRHPPRVILFDPATGKRAEAVPLEGIGGRVRSGKSFLFGDFQAPTDSELDLLARELSLHPLAIDDVRHRHQRPKIDVFPDHYFLVVYRIGAAQGRVVIDVSEVVRRLTMISTIFLPLSFITGFFGMNFQRLAGAGDRLFFASIVSIVLLPIAMLWLIRRQSIR